MKRNSIYRIFTILVSAAILFAACTKEPSDIKLNPTLSTSQVLNIKSDSATVVGFIVAAGSGFTEKGICFDIAASPTITSNKVIYDGTSKSATFQVKIGGLTRLTTYYARAYAINSSGPIYGEEVTFKTIAVIPVIANITSPVLASTTDKLVTATTSINITDDGGPDPTADITKRGVVYGLYAHPTVDSTSSKLDKYKTIATDEGTGKGTFISLATNLNGHVKYYFRAYATNKMGTAYSNEVSFTTPVSYPTVTTKAVTDITKISATSGGKVTYTGGSAITARGLVWGTSANPTTADNTIVDATSDSAFVSNITGLTANTIYHVRAYATNSLGTNYGSDIKFTTQANIIKFFVVGDYNSWNNSDAALYILSTATSTEAQGYVNFTATGGFKLTTDHSWDAAHTFGETNATTNTGVLTNPGNNISIASTGYYLIKADQGALTYSLTKTTWGVMGDYNGWASQTDMAYSATSKTFSLALHLTSGGAFKFRGTSDWNVNYGCTAADGATLDAGGTNIAVATTGDYALTLDLSHPNAYTYSANLWGMIGDFNGWGGDVVMTWDAGNSVFTGSFTATAAGAFKFRANGGWTVNLGGDINALTNGGANIAYAAAGDYTVTLDPWSLVATVTKTAKK